MRLWILYLHFLNPNFLSTKRTSMRLLHCKKFWIVIAQNAFYMALSSSTHCNLKYGTPSRGEEINKALFIDWVWEFIQFNLTKNQQTRRRYSPKCPKRRHPRRPPADKHSTKQKSIVYKLAGTGDNIAKLNGRVTPFLLTNYMRHPGNLSVVKVMDFITS